MLNTEKADLHRRGVAARKAERGRKKEIQRLQKANLAVPHNLLDTIPDPEKQAAQAKTSEEDDGFIRFEDTDTEDEMDADHDIEIKLF